MIAHVRFWHLADITFGACQSGHWYEQSGHCYEHCSSKRPQSERCQNRPRRGLAALSSLWTSAWLIATSLFIGPDLFWGTGAF